jgi:hypothetical protein
VQLVQTKAFSALCPSEHAPETPTIVSRSQILVYGFWILGLCIDGHLTAGPRYLFLFSETEGSPPLSLNNVASWD